MSKLSRILRSVEGGGLTFRCPGCQSPHLVWKGRWKYNGNPENPTFSPSVLIKSEQNGVKTMCHSFVREGRIEFLHDCTHSLAGQTVDIPDFDF